MPTTKQISAKRITIPGRTKRVRGINGHFVKSGTSSRFPQSLANQRARQKAYIARRRCMCKRLLCSFARNIIVKDDGKIHWIPASLDSRILYELMDSLFKDVYQESRKTRLSMLKSMYFKGNPLESTAPLPRVRVRGANLPQSTPTERVFAFVGWRFPFVADSYEMGNVQKWFRDHEEMLRVGITEAMSICANTFNTYVKCANKYLYSGYPRSSTACIVQDPQAERPVNVESTSGSTSAPIVSNNASAEQEIVQQRTQQADPVPGTELPQSRMTECANRIMAAARDDILYRSLRVALFPACEVEFSVLCHAWVSEYCNGKAPEGWCALQKDLFQYCLQTAKGKTDTAEYRNLRQYLSDQHEVLSLVRQSAGLPLYGNDEWSE